MTSAPRLSAAGLARLRQQLSSRDWAVLCDVGRCRLMSGRQLQHLHVGSDETAARASRRLLARLTNHGVLTRLPRQVGGVRAGSSGYIYGLGPAGYRLLHPDRPRRRLHEVRDGFLLHTISVAELYVQLCHADQRGVLELLQVETEPDCWRQFDGISGPEWLKPDLHVVIGAGPDALHSFVEVDRGSEHSPALLRKLRLYEAAYRSGSVAAATGVFPRVVWLVTTEDRAARLRRLVRAAGLTTDLHVVALHDQALAVLSGESEQYGRPPP